jgi:DNA-binding MarR family transcriptional regulator
LHSAAIHILRRVRKQDVHSGIGPAQLSALSVLVFVGPITLGELAQAEQVRPPTISRIAASLVRARLAQRVPDEKDRRIIRLQSTEKGHRLLQEARARRISDLTTRVERLASQELMLLAHAAELMEWLAREDSSTKE